MQMKRRILVVMIAAALAPSAALATNGYFPHGHGMKSKGMAGAGDSVMSHDAMGGAGNPAGMVWAGDRLDVGIDWFSPKRKIERTGSAGGLDVSVDSDKTNFFIPEFGYNKLLNPDLAVGVTVYGHGGMNTDFPGGQLNCGAGPNTANALCGSGRLGVDLMQLIIAPTLAYKFHPNHSIGIAPLFGYQRFKAEGLQAFDNAPGFPPFTSSPGNVTNRGYDSSTGYGVRIGYMGHLSPSVMIGAGYATKVRMGNFDKYKGLFAEEGGFDLPENYSIGVAFNVMPPLTLVFDYQRINYGGIQSVGNPSNVPLPLGVSGGPGFGWQNVNVYKFGVEYQYSQALTLRAGYSRGDNPIRAQDVTFNILAPGVVRDHYTLGFTYAVGKSSEITMAYMHAANHSVTGPSLFNNLGFGPNFGGTEKIEMYQNSLGIAYGVKF